MENKRKRRSKADIEQSINNAAIRIIEEKGFSGLLVTEVIHKAKIEPVVFYNRYKDLNEFIDEFVRKYDYWFNDIVNGGRNIDEEKAKYKDILNELFNSLQQNKVMQQLLKWELASNNEISRRTTRLREFHTLPLVKEYEDLFRNSPVDIVAVSALIIGGIYYLILHNNLSTFSGIDVDTIEGKQRILNAITYLTDTMFTEQMAQHTLVEVAAKMKNENIDMETIAKCTGLSLQDVQRL